MKAMIKKGDYLVIKPEWRDAGDEAFTWVARSDEQSGRVDISAVELAHLPLWPVQNRIELQHRLPITVATHVPPSDVQ